MLRVQVQGVRGLRNLVYEDRRRRGKRELAVFITVYIIAYTYAIVRTGRGEKMVVDFYPENLGWAGDIGQREPINCKTVGSHPLRGQSRTTDTAVRLLPCLHAVFLPDLQQQIRQDSSDLKGVDRGK